MGVIRHELRLTPIGQGKPKCVGQDRYREIGSPTLVRSVIVGRVLVENVKLQLAGSRSR